MQRTPLFPREEQKRMKKKPDPILPREGNYLKKYCVERKFR
jgi:hypothetical protein